MCFFASLTWPNSEVRGVCFWQLTGGQNTALATPVPACHGCLVSWDASVLQTTLTKYGKYLKYLLTNVS